MKWSWVRCPVIVWCVSIPIVGCSWHIGFDFGLFCLFDLKSGSQRVLPMEIRCFLLLGTWFHLLYIQGSLFAPFSDLCFQQDRWDRWMSVIDAISSICCKGSPHSLQHSQLTVTMIDHDFAPFPQYYPIGIRPTLGHQYPLFVVL
jgi:hypothetical protein